MRFRPNSLVALSLTTAVFSASQMGCRSMGRWNPLARFGGPETGTLADANPTIGFPSPPGQDATPQAIASIAGGTVGMPETEGLASKGNGVPSYAAAAANGFPPNGKPAGFKTNADSKILSPKFAQSGVNSPGGNLRNAAPSTSSSTKSDASIYSLPSDFAMSQGKPSTPDAGGVSAPKTGGSVFNLPSDMAVSQGTTTGGERPNIPSGYVRGITQPAGTGSTSASSSPNAFGSPSNQNVAGGNKKDVTVAFGDLASSADAKSGSDNSANGGFKLPDPSALSGMTPPASGSAATATATSATATPGSAAFGSVAGNTSGAPSTPSASTRVAMTSSDSDAASQPATRIGDASSVLPPKSSYVPSTSGSYTPGSTRTSGYPGASGSSQIQRNSFYR